MVSSADMLSALGIPLGLPLAVAAIIAILYNKMDELIKPIDNRITRKELNSLEDRGINIVLKHIAAHTDWQSGDTDKALSRIRVCFCEPLVKIQKARDSADSFEDSRKSLTKHLIWSEVSLTLMMAISVLGSFEIISWLFLILPSIPLAYSSSVCLRSWHDMRRRREDYNFFAEEASHALSRSTIEAALTDTTIEQEGAGE